VRNVRYPASKAHTSQQNNWAFGLARRKIKKKKKKVESKLVKVNNNNNNI
jgi:hypothetical protein